MSNIQQNSKLHSNGKHHSQSTNMETNNKTTKTRQFEIMVEFMEKHSQLAKGHLKTSNARQTASSLWNSLSEELNASGPPIREAAGWKKVWADFKLHTKQKLRKNKTDIGGTGGGRSKCCPLSSLEEQVVELLNMEDSVNGLGGALSFGATTASPYEKTDLLEQFIESPLQELVEEVMADAVVSPQTYGRNPRKGSQSLISCNRGMLLQKQVENQITYLKECMKSLSQLNESLKSLARYQRKDFELREKELDLATKRFKFDKNNEIDKRNLMKQKLELKEKMLQVEEEKMGLM